jgi:hypothetical protein
MKRDRDNLGKVESVSTIIVNFGTILSWLLTIFTAYVLTSQPQPISLPGVIELNAGYKLLFLTSVFLGYLQLLKRSWESQARHGKDVEGSFGSYIYGSVIKFKRPLVFIGFLIILSIIIMVIFTEVIVLAILSILLLIIILVTMFITGWQENIEKVKRRYDDEFRKRWLKRIKKQLYQNGFTHTGDFLALSEGIDEINWAIKLYFSYYEFEQNLTFNQRFLRNGLKTYEVCEVRFPHIASQIDEEQ